MLIEQVLQSVPPFGKTFLKEEFLGEESGSTITRVRKVTIVGNNFFFDAADPVYKSQCFLNTSRGPMALTFDIKASSLEEAIAGWRQAACDAIIAFQSQLRENERRIIIPEGPNPSTH